MKIFKSSQRTLSILAIVTLISLLSSILPIESRAAPAAPEITAAEIDSYLAGKGSPLAGLGQVFVDRGREFDIDPRLLVAIAGAESSFGTRICTAYNAWNWFYSGWCSSPFDSWPEGIYSVTRGLRLYYFNQGRTTLSSIRDKYCPGCTNWLTNVTIFYRDELGGDLSDLTFQGSGGDDDGDAVIVEEPTLTPSYGPTCQTAWYRFTNNRGRYAYLTLNTNDPAQSTNSGRWTPNLPRSGRWRVEAFVPNHEPLNWPCTGDYIDWDTSDARYTIHYNGGSTTVSSDQATLYDGWLNLGTYDFAAGSSGYVELSDLNGEANISYFVSFSAMRFTWVEASESSDVVLEEPNIHPAYGGGMCDSAWYRYTNDRGHYAYLTVNTNDPAQSTNWADWQPDFSYAGDYKVEAYIPNHDPVNWQCPSMYLDWDTSDAHYTIHHADGQSTVSHDQAPLYSEWLDLGTYRFEVGSEGRVELSDLNDETNWSRTVSFSAMRFTLQESGPTPTPTPTPLPTPEPTPAPTGEDIADAALNETGAPYSANRRLYCGTYGPWEAQNSVCTDLVIDAYLAGTGGTAPSDTCHGNDWYDPKMQFSSGGANLYALLRADAQAHPGRYQYPSNGARNAEDLRRYFYYQQLYLGATTDWRVGDVAFFEWGSDNMADHVAIVTAVGADGLPDAIMHAHGVPDHCGGGACEDDWNNHYQSHLMGHGRLASMHQGQTAALAPALQGAESNVWQALHVSVQSPSNAVAMTLYDPNGREVHKDMSWELVASNNDEFIPYIPYALQSVSAQRQAITVSHPITGVYQAILTSTTSTTFEFAAATSQEGNVVHEETFAGSLSHGEMQVVPLDLTYVNDAPWADEQAPLAAAWFSLPESVEAEITPGELVTSSVVLGAPPADVRVSLELSDFSSLMGDQLPGDGIALNQTTFTMTVGQPRQVYLEVALSPGIASGRYLGALMVHVEPLSGQQAVLNALSQSGYTRRVPVVVHVKEGRHRIYLPLVTRDQ